MREELLVGVISTNHLGDCHHTLAEHLDAHSEFRQQHLAEQVEHARLEQRLLSRVSGAVDVLRRRHQSTNDLQNEDEVRGLLAGPVFVERRALVIRRKEERVGQRREALDQAEPFCIRWR